MDATNNIEKFSWVVSNISEPIRLDIFCANKLTHLTRSQIKNGIQAVRVNGSLSKLSKKVNNEDIVDLYFKNPKPNNIQLFNYPLKIIYEDKNIIVVNKPSGMVTHPAPGHYNKTLVNALEYYRRNVSAIKDEYSQMSLDFNEESLRRGIVHRLDKDTSGLIITVRNNKAKKYYIQQFKKRKIKKYYIAILDKPLSSNEGLLRTSIARAKNNRKKFIAKADTSLGKIALTRFKVLKRLGNFYFVLFRIFTGRTHQIRVHSKLLNSGIVGDKIYTKDKKNPFMLHALELSFITQEGKHITLKTKIPKRFLDFYNKHKTD